MTTKEQERKALAQIQKIVAGLGEDSYIGMAFEGVFEVAEENINNDWACSLKQSVENRDAQIEKLNRRIERFLAEDDAKLKEINRLQGELNVWMGRFDGLMKKHEEQVAELQDRISELEESLRDLQKKSVEDVMEERKDVTIQTTDDYSPTVMPFARVQYFDNEGFRFINVVQKSGWTTSYKLDDIKSLVIE